MARWGLIGIIVIVLGIAGCTEDKGANSETPLEAARYPALEEYLDSALAEFCGAFHDALDARFETDTALIPGIEWPFEMPPRRRDGQTNFVDENTSWGVGYNRQIDTTRYAAFWDLGRLVDTGVLLHTSPIVATRVEHQISYGRLDGFGDDETSWDGIIDVSLSDLDADSANLSATFEGSHQVGERCGGLACDVLELTITSGRFGKLDGNLELSTLSGIISGTFKFTEFDVILGHDAIYTWEIQGTVANGVVTATASSGNFSATSTYYSLCSGIGTID